MHSSFFTGVLLLPSKSVFGTTAEVTLGDNTPVAVIHRKAWSARPKFEIFDAADTTLLATGKATGFLGNHYELVGPRAEPLLSLKFSGWSGPRRATVTLPDGRELTASGNWSARDYTVADSAGNRIAGLVTTSSAWTWKPDSLAFEINAPALTLLQAIGLAQCIRTAVEASRAAAAG
ncbi:hypothetical protein [Actinoplanes sp. NPDC049599]|uniref:hypothetical protein n=1 Tax=Actinoplanes sp. NPDC049599 TaxID=3363903 RepID=UPI00379663E8